MPYITRSVSKKIEEQKKKIEEEEQKKKIEEQKKKAEENAQNYYTRSKVAARQSIFIIEMKKLFKEFRELYGRHNKIDQFNTIMQYVRDNKIIIEKPQNHYFKSTVQNKIIDLFYEDNVEMASEWHFRIFGKHLK